MEARTAAIEDVLYQKGASFSAKLDETNGHIIDNAIDIDVHSDSSITPTLTTRLTDLQNNPRAAPSREYFESLPTIANSANYQLKAQMEDISIYDDVNNNRLNLPPINDRFTIREAPEIPRDRIKSLNVPLSVPNYTAPNT